MPFIKCRFCGKQFSDKLSICPFCKKEAMVQPALQTLPTTSQQTAQKSAKRYVNPIIVVSVIIALAISFIGYKFYLNIEKRRAEIAKEKQKLQADREFSALVVAISGKMIKLAIDSENVVDEINRAWHEAIFSKYKKRDFNDAIIEVHRERS